MPIDTTNTGSDDATFEAGTAQDGAAFADAARKPDAAPAIVWRPEHPLSGTQMLVTESRSAPLSPDPLSAAPANPAPQSDPTGVNIAFQQHVISSNVFGVEDLIRSKPPGFDINVMMSGTDRQNALQFYVAQVQIGTLAMSRALMGGGIHVAHLDGKGKSAYQLANDIASFKGSSDYYKALAGLLRDDLNSKLSQAIAGDGVGKDDAWAGRLLAAGADPNAPLFMAVFARDARKVAAIIANMPKGADINAFNSDGRTALQQAATGYHIADDTVLTILKSLVEHGHADLALKGKLGRSALEVALVFEHFKVPYLDRVRSKYLESVMTLDLRHSVLDGSERRSIALLEAGADPALQINADLSKSQGITLLMFAAANKNSNTVKALLDASFPAKLSKGFLNHQGSAGNTALHAAAFSGDARARQFLKEAGADETIENNQGQTANDIPNGLDKRFLLLSSLLVADAVLVGAIFLSWAISSGSRLSFPDFKPGPFNLGDPTASVTDTSPSPLAQAILDGNQDAAKNLIGTGADPQARIIPGLTALAYAASDGEVDTVKAQLAAIPQDELKAIINKQGMDGLTALHAAGYAGRQDIYNIIRAAGGDEVVKDVHDWTPAEALAGKLSGLQPRGNPVDFPYRPGQGRMRNALQRFLLRVVRNTFGANAQPAHPPASPISPPPVGGDPGITHPIGPSSPTSDLLRTIIAQMQHIHLRFGIQPTALLANTSRPEVDIGTLHVVGDSGTDSQRLFWISERLSDLLTAHGSQTGRLVLNFIVSDSNRIVTHLNRSPNLVTAESATRATQDANFVQMGTENRGGATDIIMIHEFIHVIQFNTARSRGNANPPAVYVTVTGAGGRETVLDQEEPAAVGLGHFGINNILTENAYRAQMGYTRRDFYGSANELAENGQYGQISKPFTR